MILVTMGAKYTIPIPVYIPISISFLSSCQSNDQDCENNKNQNPVELPVARTQYEIQLKEDAEENPSIEDLAKTYGIPRNITIKGDKFYAKSVEEDSWLINAINLRKVKWPVMF